VSRALAFLVAFVVAIATASGGCGGDGVSATRALEEPIRVEGGQFFSGALPGVPEPAEGVDAGASPTPLVSDVEPTTTVAAPGAQSLDFAGHASPNAETVAVRFADMGTGYWVVPVGGPDPTANGSLTWDLTADFAHDIPPGPHTLVFAAIGADGASGGQFTIPFCIDTPVPDNLNACLPTKAPPAAVLSLSWDTHVDLDLIVQTPSGAVVGGKKVTTAPKGTSVSAASGGSNAVLDHDSNRNCAIDGIDREDVVWQAPPASGTYEVWADLFAACGQSSVRFTAALWLPAPRPDGGTELVQQAPLASGELLASQANGGSSNGLYLGAFTIQ
jgi:hypothetical protein